MVNKGKAKSQDPLGLFVLLTCFRKMLNPVADFIANALEKCPFLFFRSFGFRRIVKSPVNPLHMRGSDRTVVGCVSAEGHDQALCQQWIQHIVSINFPSNEKNTAETIDLLWN